MKLKKTLTLNVKKQLLIANGTLFAAGAAGYALIEVLWRGYTHWSMAVAGGVCFLEFGRLWEKLKTLKRIYIPLFGSAVITFVELVFGVLFNIILKKRVWDYSRMPFQFMGQICVLFSTLWGLLSIIALPLAGKIRAKITKN